MRIYILCHLQADDVTNLDHLKLSDTRTRTNFPFLYTLLIAYRVYRGSRTLSTDLSSNKECCNCCSCDIKKYYKLYEQLLQNTTVLYI